MNEEKSPGCNHIRQLHKTSDEGTVSICLNCGEKIEEVK